MSDYISREEALIFARKAHAKGLNILDYLEEVPAADVRPVTRAYWVWDKNGMDWGLGAWCCSACKCRAETWWANGRTNNPIICAGGRYCGNCGAEMIGQDRG